MKIKVLIGILVFLILLNLATIGTWVYLHFISPPEPKFPESGWKWNRPPMPRLRPPIHHLPLEQQQKLRSLLKELRQAKRPLESELRELHFQLREALQDTNVSMDSLQTLLDSLAAVQRQINEVVIQHFLKARQLLPAEQYQQLLNHLRLPRNPFIRGRRFPDFNKLKQGRYTQ